MEPTDVALVGALVVAFACVSMRIERWPLTMPMVFVGAGALGHATGVVEVSTDNEAITLLAEITLAVILFADAVRIDVPRLRSSVAMPLRLLAIGLPLTVALGSMVNSLLFPGLAFAQVALLAAILAPTDAALGAAVIEDESVPVRERLALNVESGVNDGLAVPIVAVLLAIVVGENRTIGSWIGFVAQQVGLGALVGVIIGAASITALRAAHERGWSDARFEQLATLLVPVVALFSAIAVEGNSFIAAFVAGLTFGGLGAATRPDETPLATRLDAFTEDAGQLFGVAAFFLFGNVLLPDAVDELTVAVITCAVLTLTVGRMLPVWIALIGTRTRWPTRLFVGWFGPRGLASIIFGLLLLEETESMGADGEQIFAVIALTVTASVILHGITAAPGARLYGRWAERMRADSPGDVDDMDRIDHPGPIPAVRWSARSRRQRESA